MARVACSNGRRGGEGERKKKRYLERCFGILREVVIFVLRNDLGETCYRIIISFSSLFSFFLPEFFEEESSLGETIDDSRRDYFFFSSSSSPFFLCFAKCLKSFFCGFSFFSFRRKKIRGFVSFLQNCWREITGLLSYPFLLNI